jgi:hypothetical protein
MDNLIELLSYFRIGEMENEDILLTNVNIFINI